MRLLIAFFGALILVVDIIVIRHFYHDFKRKYDSPEFNFYDKAVIILDMDKQGKITITPDLKNKLNSLLKNSHFDNLNGAVAVGHGVAYDKHLTAKDISDIQNKFVNEEEQYIKKHNL